MTFIGHVWLWSMASFSPSDTCTEPDISIIKDATHKKAPQVPPQST